MSSAQVKWLDPQGTLGEKFMENFALSVDANNLLVDWAPGDCIYGVQAAGKVIVSKVSRREAVRLYKLYAGSRLEPKILEALDSNKLMEHIPVILHLEDGLYSRIGVWRNKAN